MRRTIALASVILVGLGVPSAASAKSAITPSAVRVSATQALIRAVWNSDSVGFIRVEHSTNTKYATVANVREPLPITGNGDNKLTLAGLKPGTTYHLRGHITEPNALPPAPKDTVSGDITFTTAPLGAAVLSQQDALDTGNVQNAKPPPAAALPTCAGTGPLVAGTATMTDFAVYLENNTQANPVCVTVRVKSDCLDLRVGGFVGQLTGTATGVAAANVLPPT